ncbi:hypothetical protein [Kutzneria sp. CA-103260]|uniref:hypothetical protein n=1 Tax=Kutzneria sp. CA-103260 TaxID=2802641 RepID=UPI001BA7E9AD|nr:hypothetical protein [Kutzneria sp. CA-103260]QUQ62660.1 hypothetical protein JJ691_03720 [Kutzneria sp. CA-103260]
MTTESSPPTTVRRIAGPAASALADLVAVFDELQTVLRCCERLVSELAADPADSVVLEGVWTTVTLSYARCFADGRLTDEDVNGLSLKGEVLEWHKLLRRLREHYASETLNPRARFDVGAAAGPDGQVAGIAITSVDQAVLDDLTVRQTGALAYELTRLVDQRINDQQQQVLTAARALPPQDLAALPLIDLATPH